MSRKIVKKEEIKTNRLVLKPLSEKDKERLFYLLTNKMVNSTFMVPDFNDEKMYELVDKLISFSNISDTAHLEYGIYLDDILIGFLNDCDFDEETIEIGYVIDPKYKGNGYATEAFNALIKELKDMGFKTVLASYFEENIASRRVMEKCGLKENGEVEDIEYKGSNHKCIYFELKL